MTSLETSSFDFTAGELLLLDKPKGWTSFDVVNRVRYRLRKITGIKRIKVGHSGTLDPMATGLLLVATGKMTKQLTGLTGLGKTYDGTIHFGESTPSYDAETEVDARYPTEHLTPEGIAATMEQHFTGTIEQVPPIYSAIKVDGKRAYKSARAGQTVDLPTREVTVSRFELLETRLPEIDFVADVSKGTYIRSLAHDLGKACASGAHLSALRRTSIGEYQLSDAFNLEKFAAHLDKLVAEL